MSSKNHFGIAEITNHQCTITVITAKLAFLNKLSMGIPVHEHIFLCLSVSIKKSRGRGGHAMDGSSCFVRLQQLSERCQRVSCGSQPACFYKEALHVLQHSIAKCHCSLITGPVPILPSSSGKYIEEIWVETAPKYLNKSSKSPREVRSADTLDE